jgi:hypothetical protein
MVSLLLWWTDGVWTVAVLSPSLERVSWWIHPRALPGRMVFARREFVMKKYTDIKSCTLALSFLICECSGIQT